MPTVALETLGCRANRYDSDGMALALEKAGFDLVAPGGHADVYVINTCTVTERTDRQDRQTIYRAQRTNPEAAIIVTGCYAQVAPEEVAAIDGVHMVVGTAGKPFMARFVEQALAGNRGVFVDDPTGNLFEDPVTRFVGRTRAALKIQDGCNYNCAFCIIPTARGRARSNPVDVVVAHARALAADGFEEVVLTGIHLGDYGKDLRPRRSLTELVAALAETGAGPRIRISSLDPHEVPDDLVELVARHERVCRHLHVCLQSGSDRVLRAMRRHYDYAEFERLVTKIYEADPSTAIGTDVIVGFPTETEAEHAQTMARLESLPLSYLHVFPYSSRKGTAAAEMDGHLDPAVIKERTAQMLELAGAKRAAFYAQQDGAELDVLVETPAKREPGWVRGFTDNYLPVLVPGDVSELVGRRVRVRVERAASAESAVRGIIL